MTKIPRGADPTQAAHLEILTEEHWNNLAMLERLKEWARLLHSSSYPDAPRAEGIFRRIYARAMQLRNMGIATFGRK